jgi:hypothetical protein
MTQKQSFKETSVMKKNRICCPHDKSQSSGTHIFSSRGDRQQNRGGLPIAGKEAGDSFRHIVFDRLRHQALWKKNERHIPNHDVGYSRKKNPESSTGF